MNMLNQILDSFGLDPASHRVGVFGAGLINHTYKIEGNHSAYILQKINTSVFKRPVDIADNLSLINHYLKQTHPGYLFAAPLQAASGKYLVQTNDGDVYRLLPFVPNSHTINVVRHERQAFEAARQFARFTRLMNHFDPQLLKYTLPDFHNLNLRYGQFEDSLKQSSAERLQAADAAISKVNAFSFIKEKYNGLIAENRIPLRVIHHDTKINNVLFDAAENGLCVIDLDTIMPGYFMSDTGDMLRTYLSPVNEEEKDLSKISINEDFFRGIYRGYMCEMGDLITQSERENFLFSGKMMIYMQALRFLTDYLNNDSYYGSAYPGHNLSRAQNQITLLEKFCAAEDKLQEIIAIAEKEY
jgi:Ser/Thr protein kinase RdoA (MazF antagonist)